VYILVKEGVGRNTSERRKGKKEFLGREYQKAAEGQSHLPREGLKRLDRSLWGRLAQIGGANRHSKGTLKVTSRTGKDAEHRRRSRDLSHSQETERLKERHAGSEERPGAARMREKTERNKERMLARQR